MKNFNQKYAEHPELSVFKEFFLSHGKYKEINLKSASNLNGNLNCSKELEHYAS